MRMNDSKEFVTLTEATRISGYSMFWLRLRFDSGAIAGQRDKRGRRLLNVKSLRAYMRAHAEYAERKQNGGH
jgi:hypothetical protein